jgi:hypothetical protein
VWLASWTSADYQNPEVEPKTSRRDAICPRDVDVLQINHLINLVSYVSEHAILRPGATLTIYTMYDNDGNSFVSVRMTVRCDECDEGKITVSKQKHFATD